jgi:hypothetical protein
MDTFAIDNENGDEVIVTIDCTKDLRQTPLLFQCHQTDAA